MKDQIKTSVTDIVCAFGVCVFTVLTAIMIVQQIIAGEFLK